jgi:carotenoid cleavage dioxygenase-like enzyme
MPTTEDLARPAHLLGNGAPVAAELTLTDLRVRGTIPPELDGRYVRNGANPYTGTSDHPFFGDGMIHGVRIRDGVAEWYRNRYVKTPFISNPSLDILDPAVALDMSASKANTHVIGHAGKILALEEGHFPYVLDGNLETQGPTDYAGALTGSFTAHPKICPVTGELVAFGYSAFPPYLRYIRVSADGRLVQTEAINVGGPTMMHDFNMTENYVIFMDLPAVFDLDLALRGEMPIRWDNDYPARLGVMPRNGNDASVVWYDIDPCYVFHPLNAYEDGDSIVIDVSRMSHVWRDGPTDFPSPMLHRWTIDTKTRKVHERQIDDHPADFPRVPDSKVGQPHRYGYLTGFDVGMSYAESGAHHGRLLKYDQRSGARSSIDVGLGRHPGEAVFVPSATARTEDDGYLITYVYDTDADRSECVIFDAATMSDEPIAAIELPRVPFGFHGSWIGADVVG